MPPLTPEMRAAALELRAREAALYKNPDPQSGFDVGIRVHAATIAKNERGEDEIHLSVVVTGMVLRPEAYAQALGHTVTLKAPAKVTRKDSDEL